MDVVIPGLLISDLRAAENVKLLDAHHISHVLCLGWEYDAHRDMVHLKGNHVIEILDDEDANLLDHLPDCIAFISAAIDGGGVCLVHCQAGVSRSAAVVVAYMMARMGMTRDEALERLRGVRAVVDPNAGFMMQLEIFGAMGCRVDGENHTYRRYALGQMALEQSGLGQISNLRLAQDPATNAQLLARNGCGLLNGVPAFDLKCKKCRYEILFDVL
ncbi:phosphatase [Irineochytrium annulatum]|nr:phosphatase [Irineochytrium annulatum]